ncbi:hypothetical protein [Roseimarinus sediminis]|uniref:hypothetical protein n=1 Tax=Roseimarinus sediminis TaxID=1610899 RepID=UPI003D227CEA
MKWLGQLRSISFTYIALMHCIAFNAEALAQEDTLAEPVFFAHYAADANNAVSRSLQGQQHFKVNDISNGTWTLTVPEQPFSSSSVAISVAPLAYAEVDTSLGVAIGGLQFEPSGLMLTRPIKVNITFQEDFEQPLLFLLFNSTGELTLVPVQQVNGRTYSIEVPHFSGLVAMEPSNPSKLCTLERIKLQLAIQEGEQLLNKELGLTVEPVSVDPVCDKIDSALNALIDSNVVAMLEPEYSAINKIMNAHAMTTRCHTGDLTEIQMPEIVKKLVVRTVNKSLMALDQYQYDPERFIALARMALVSDRGYGLMYDTGLSKTLIDALIRYLKNNREYYRHKIAAEHHLEYLKEFYNTYRTADLFKSNVDDRSNWNELIAALKKLYRFELELELTINGDADDHTDWEQSEQTHTTGKMILVMDIGKYGVSMAFPSDGYDIALEGSGRFVTDGSCEHHDPEGDSQSQLQEQVFLKKYRIELNLCEGTGRIRVDAPGRSTEKWAGDEPLTSSLHLRGNVTNNTFYYLEFQGIKEFIFPFHLEMGQQELFERSYIGNKVFEENQSKSHGELRLKMKHVPL